MKLCITVSRKVLINFMPDLHNVSLRGVRQYLHLSVARPCSKDDTSIHPHKVSVIPSHLKKV